MNKISEELVNESIIVFIVIIMRDSCKFGSACLLGGINKPYKNKVFDQAGFAVFTKAPEIPILVGRDIYLSLL